MSSFVDHNFRSIDQSNTIDVVPELLEASVIYNDTLKLSSKIKNVTVANKTITNHNEDCVDLCRVSDSDFLRLTLRPYGQNGITVKGASSNNKFRELRFEIHGKRCDIELGQFDNYWFPGRPPTRDNVFTALNPGVVDTFPQDAVGEQTPVRVILWDAKYNHFEFAHVKIITVPKFIWFPYFLFRYVWLRTENVVRRLRKLNPIVTE